MDLIKITDLTGRMDISSRSLRYYEQMGLIKSIRLPFQKYRYYDEANIERLKQILVLRKMQISVKDILHIYESEDMSVVVETFVNRLQDIDREVHALSRLKSIVNEFLQAMISHGITKISALPLLYEEMDRQLEVMDKHEPATYAELSDIAERLHEDVPVSIVDLPSMRMLSSQRRDGGGSDADGFADWLSLHNIPRGIAGRHEAFEYQESGSGDIVLLQKIGEEFVNDSPFMDVRFPGGLFAQSSLYVDEDLGAFHRAMVKSFDDNAYYEVDYRQAALVEQMLSPDQQRDRVAVYLPVQKRRPNESLYAPVQQAAHISWDELEEANPVLWSRAYPLENGQELEFQLYRNSPIATGIKVQIPYRVDMEFRMDRELLPFYAGEVRWLASVRFAYGHEQYSVNAGNTADVHLSKEAITFDQPVTGRHCSYPGIGRIKIPAVNHLTWIVGEKHFAVIINGEVRYCGMDFPYMQMDLSTYPPQEIIVDAVGANRVYFSKIEVSQLRTAPKINLKKGEMIMATKQSNHLLPDIRDIINGMEGKNFALNDCMAFLMERLEEKRPWNYWTFTGITGDGFTMVYNRNQSTYCEYCVSGYLAGEDYMGYVFDAIGYEHTYVTEKMLNTNKTMYLQTLMAYIDRGIPVLVETNLTDTPGMDADVLTHFLYVGYEDYGKTLLFLSGDSASLHRYDTSGDIRQNWIFAGDKKRDIPAGEVVLHAAQKIPYWMTLPEKDGMFFGPAAFRAWAEDIEKGRYEKETDLWSNYCVYICNMATNSGGALAFLDQLKRDYPQYKELAEKVAEQYTKTGNQEGGLWKTLEDLGGGFNASLEALQDKERRRQIAEKIREAAACSDRVIALLKEGFSLT